MKHISWENIELSAEFCPPQLICSKGPKLRIEIFEFQISQLQLPEAFNSSATQAINHLKLLEDCTIYFQHNTGSSVRSDQVPVAGPDHQDCNKE